MKLNRLIAQYVTFRNALGTKFEASGSVLHTFARAVGEGRHVGNVNAHQVVTFLNRSGPTTRNWHRKYSVLGGLFQYAVSRGYISASPMPPTVRKLPERYKPYIYSPEELRRLLDGTAASQRRRFHIEAHTFRSLLLLLYGAGLRVGEARRLNLEDVDLKQAILTIRDTKFYKTRLVPLGKELNDVMVRYAEQRRKAGHPQNADAPFFVTRRGVRLAHYVLDRNFKRLRARAHIRREDGARYQPRLHDLRHTAAVHRLTAWYREGQDVQRLLPLLSTYLGHASIACTQASKLFARYVFGEVSHG
jgi:integrase/recombinase XerD